MNRIVALLFAAILPVTATAAVQTKKVEYEIDGRTHIGYLAHDDATTPTKKRAGVLIIPEWWGMNDYVQRRARQIAELGYVAFVADMYGEGKVTKEREEAGKLAGELRGNRAELRKRTQAGLDQLKQRTDVDGDRVAAIGYCFGGTAVLDLARAGGDMAGVVSFHGSLGFPDPVTTGSVQAPALVLHGADDPMVPQEQVDTFLAEMKAAGAEVEFVAYPDAVHSFTNPDAGDDKSKGSAYQKEADEKSWVAMKKFFARVLGNGGDR